MAPSIGAFRFLFPNYVIFCDERLSKQTMCRIAHSLGRSLHTFSSKKQGRRLIFKRATNAISRGFAKQQQQAFKLQPVTLKAVHAICGHMFYQSPP